MARKGNKAHYFFTHSSSHKQKSRFLHTGENVMFAVLEYFKLLAQKPTNLASFFSIYYNSTRGVFVGLGGW